MMNFIKNFLGTVVLAVVCLTIGYLVAGMCADKKAGAPSGTNAMAAMMNAPITVATATVESKPYNPAVRYVAHAEPVQEVDLLPQVDGYIKEVCFKEGDLVKEGQLLYILDGERYEAVVRQREADLEAAKAEQRRADRQLQRMTAADARGITQLEMDAAEAGSETAKAKVLQAEANLIVAKYDLKKTEVKAPIAGQIGKSSAYVGDYVAPSKGPLARIVQTDPIRVSFPLPDRRYIEWREREINAKKAGSKVEQFRFTIELPNGEKYAHEGEFAFDDNTMSKETASIMLRVNFANPERVLVPNTFVTMHCDDYTPASYPTVQQTAVFDLPGGNLGVYVITDEGRVKVTPVKTLPVFEGFIPVTEGLEVGQKYVISGTAKLRDGAKFIEVPPTPTAENDPNYKGFNLDK